jgi:Putative zinc-finger
MDHKDAVRLKAAERYLLNELDPDQLDQYEEHLFDCQECALDLRAAAMFVEQSKNMLTEPARIVSAEPVRKSPGWFAWLRPASAVPAMAVLLAVVGYQNLVSIPHIKEAASHPEVLPWVSLNIATFGGENPEVVTGPGKGFLLFVRIPPDGTYVRYNADLYNPAGKLEWSTAFAATKDQDQWPIAVPGSNRQTGTYTLKVSGVTAAGESKDLGRTSFDLKIQP